jgi:hypothetical protein
MSLSVCICAKVAILLYRKQGLNIWGNKKLSRRKDSGEITELYNFICILETELGKPHSRELIKITVGQR